MAVLLPELLDHIFDLLRSSYDKRTLRACLLTSRDWSVSCRRHLYRDTYVLVHSRKRGITNFLTHLHDCPDVGPCIRNLDLSPPIIDFYGPCDPGGVFDIDVQCIQSLLSLMVNLTSLRMKNLFIRVQMPPRFTYPPTLVPDSPRCLRKLSMDSCHFMIPMDNGNARVDRQSLKAGHLILRFLSLFERIDAGDFMFESSLGDPAYSLEDSAIQIKLPSQQIQMRSLLLCIRPPSPTSNVVQSCVALERLEKLTLSFRGILDPRVLADFISRAPALRVFRLETGSVRDPCLPDYDDLSLRADLSKCPHLQKFSFETTLGYMSSDPLELWYSFCALLRTAPQTLSDIEIELFDMDYWDRIEWNDLSEILLPFQNLSRVYIFIDKPKQRKKRGPGGIPVGAKPPGGAVQEIKQSLSWLDRRGVLYVDPM